MKIKIDVSGATAVQKHINGIANKITQLSHDYCAVTLPTYQVFIDWTCPDTACRATFKVHMNTWAGSRVMYCVKCGKQQAKDTFISAAQRTYATDVAFNTIVKKYNLGSTSRPHTYSPIDADTETVCMECQCCFVVRGKFGYCPQCGRHSCLQWAIHNIASLKNKAYSSEQDIQTGYKEIVDILKTCGDQILDIYNQRYSTTHSISLQNFEVAEDALRNKIGINLKEVFPPEQLSTIVIGINIRHICAYNAGVIDRGFIKRTNSHHNQIGRVHRFRSDELHTFIELVERLLQFYFDKITTTS
jgi:hypothetical protein